MGHRSSTRSGIAPPTEIERFSFWDGQTLRADDLNRLVDVAEARRCWHNRAVHNAYGIACGLEVSPVRPGQKKSAKAMGLHLGHGVAYDAFGRMLFSPFDRDLPFPSDVPASVDACLLVMRARRAESSACACSPAPRCCGSEPAREDEGIELLWAEESRVQWPESVPLARVVFGQAARRDPRLDPTFVVPRLRPARRPQIVADQTVPGATQWMAGPATLVRPVLDQRSIVWFPIDVVVDTSAAGFSETPAYFAELAGSIVDVSRVQRLHIRAPHIVDETPQRFTFRFWILVVQFLAEIEVRAHAATGVVPAFTYDGFRDFARRQRLHVAWLGCEGETQLASPDARERLPRYCGCTTPAMPLSI